MPAPTIEPIPRNAAPRTDMVRAGASGTAESPWSTELFMVSPDIEQ